MRSFAKHSRCLVFTVSVFILFAARSAWAASPEGDFTFDPGTHTITGYSGPGGAVEIPSTIGGVAVISIGDSAFQSCTTLTSMTIPSGVTSIGVNAFVSCSSLISITIPSGVTSIGAQAFRGCNALLTVVIPGSVTSIGIRAFYQCSHLATVYFEGDEPGYFGTGVFDFTPRTFKIFYKSTSLGFSYPTWQGYPCFPRYLVTFDAGTHGSIEGTISQFVIRASSSTPVTAVANSGYKFVNWTFSTNDAPKTQNPLTLTNLVRDVAVTANFAINASIATNVTSLNVPEEGTAVFKVKLCAPPTDTKTVTVSRTSGDTDITVSAGSSLTFNSGNWDTYQDVTLAAAKDADAANGKAVITCSAPDLTSTTVTATEIDNDYILTISADKDGTTDPSSPTIVEKGMPQSILAIPNIGRHFLNWTVISGTGSFTNELKNEAAFFTASANATIKANFTPDTNTLTVGRVGNGTVTSATDKTVAAYTATPITAKADANWHFVNWTLSLGSGTFANSNSASTTFTPTGAHGATATIHATFEHNTAVLTMLNSGNGTITPDVGSITVNTATAIPITATVVSADYHFSNWTVTGGAKVANPNSANTTATLTSNGTVKANFAHDTAVLTMAKVGGQAITPLAGSKTVDTATAIPITATATSPTYPFVNWTVSGIAVVANPDAASTSVTLTGNATVTANFIMPIVNGTAISAISGNIGAIRQYKINVPAGQVLFEVKSYGGTGDADLTVSKDGTILKYGFGATSNETLQIESPVAGDYIIGVNAAATYSGLSLMAKYYSAAIVPLHPLRNRWRPRKEHIRMRYLCHGRLQPGRQVISYTGLNQK